MDYTLWPNLWDKAYRHQREIHPVFPLRERDRHHSFRAQVALLKRLGG